MYPKNLIFDFETDGIGDFKTQRAIQIAWIITDSEYNILDEKVYFIKGVKEINTDFHKHISLKLINKIGLDLKTVIIYFLDRIKTIINNNGKIIAHNASFDINILKNEMRHLGFADIDLSKYVYCTKKNTVNLCKIPIKGKNYYKFPKLIELYNHLFGKDPDIRLHDALNDTKVLYDCCKELKI